MTYESTCLADSPSFFWALNDVITTAADASGNGATGTYSGGYTQGVTGPSGVGLNGVTVNGSTGFIFLNSTVSSPDVFTLETWFQTSTSGRAVAGFSNAQSLGSGTFDRMMYINSSSQLGFYIFGATDPVSTSTYTDGNWHYAAVTYSNVSGNVTLYADGSQVAQTTGFTSPFNYGGYWLAGGDAGRAAQGVTAPLNGSLCAFAVYPAELTSGRIAAHYAAASGTTPVASPQPYVVPSLAAIQAACW